VSRQRRERQAARQAGETGGRRRVFRVVEAALWVAVVGLFIWRISPQVQAAVGWGGSGGTAAPAVTFDMLDGRLQPLRALKGQVVLVNFWATWCPPCRAEMPGFQKVYQSRHADGFTVVGVSMDELPPQQVASFLRDHGIAYPVAMASPDVALAFGGVNSFPTSFLIDRQGRVRYTVRGIFAEVTLRAAIDRLLAEPR
jgi:peroxiredoxin